MRLFILSDSPPEKDVQWSDQGMMASFKFIQKVWILNSKILQKINIIIRDESRKFNKFTNQLIIKLTKT